MGKVLRVFERIIVMALLGLMMVAIFASTIELAITLFRQLFTPPAALLDLDEMLKVFGFFLMVLIGLELLETIKGYLEDDTVHAEIVCLVAIVAVARKIIILDYKEMSPGMLLSMAAVIVALGAGYFLVRRGQAHRLPGKKPPSDG